MRFEPKFKQLQDKNWLQQKYIDEQISSPEIAKIVGCHRTSVTEALKRLGIRARDRKTARNLVPLQSFKYDLLNDRNWLHQKYVIEGLATDVIADLAGAKTANSARQALMRFGIAIRNRSDSITHKRISDGFVLDERTQQIIEGGLLGDAFMSASNRHSDISYPSFARRNKYYDHVLWVAQELCGNRAEERVKSEIHTLKGKKCPTFKFETLVHKELLPIYRRWYPTANGFRKSVPADLILTPTILLHWFLDDGSTSYRIRSEQQYKSNKWKQRTKPIRLCFCSESFSREENEFLCKQMAGCFSIGAKVIKANSGTGWRIQVPHAEVNSFLQLIGKPPIESLRYKWKEE